MIPGSWHTTTNDYEFNVSYSFFFLFVPEWFRSGIFVMFSEALVGFWPMGHGV